jgi:hypothetical protein
VKGSRWSRENDVGPKRGHRLRPKLSGKIAITFLPEALAVARSDALERC